MKKNKGNTSIGVELSRSQYYKQASARQITDVSRLLESPEHKQKVDLMRKLKWDQALTRTETLVGNEKERSGIMKELSGDVSKLDEIEEIAVTYGLKFLPATKFLCPEKFEVSLSTILADFLQSKGLDNHGLAHNNFYILADEKHFIKRQMDIDDELGIFVFYLPPKGGDNYMRVEQVGHGKLTLWRYLDGWRNKNPMNNIFHTSFITFFVALPILAVFGIGKAIFLSLVLSVGASIFFLDRKREAGGFNAHMWNQLPMKND